MKMIFATVAAPLALVLSGPAIAQDKTVPADDAEQLATDPARLAAAKVTVDYLFPLGTYERMMKGTMDEMMDSIINQSLDRSMAETMKDMGIDDPELDELGDASINDMMLERDPHFRERMQISTRVMTNEMVDLMTSMEPALRKSLANIYARKFTADQLAEMNAFFATETGGAFARDYMMVFVDPEMMQSMMGFVPEMMQAMPAIMKKVEEATTHLPPPLTQDTDARLQDEDE
ncbi:DUF2059 domain-containing protein [Sphingorhabdus sp. SMR4y]|uniref:DUF2059 domain-containing protein n=1 Tax=Sphingorhabdus sp. SMR4y TaxID=2584094 RepID=UPI000B61CFAA|nr:DUF2059 domain-containing protein [Sphingorhabdus sp. SMR4y]ASK89271.1 hypothetical protein SPHFLASMR4Y_02532 [Sphingorhabdus sp. SMR4y]